MSQKTVKKVVSKKVEVPRANVAHPAKDGFYTRPVKRVIKGSGFFIRSLIRLGKDTDAILKEVAKKFPDSQAGTSDVAWNRYMLKKGRYSLEAKG